MHARAYIAEFTRNGERRSFRVLAYNKDEAYLEACQALQAAGEEPNGGPGDTVRWWYVGAERASKRGW
jgi:hypothetical protein